MKYFNLTILCLALFACATPHLEPETPLARQIDGKPFNIQKKILSKACLKEARWAPHPRRTNYNASYENLCVQMKKAMRNDEYLNEKDAAGGNLELRRSLAAQCGSIIREYANLQDAVSVKHSQNMSDICKLMTGSE